MAIERATFFFWLMWFLFILPSCFHHLLCRRWRWRRAITPSGRWSQQQQLALQIWRCPGLRPPSASKAWRDSSRGLHHPRFASHHLYPPRRRPCGRQGRLHKLRQEGRGQEEEKEEEGQEGQEGEGKGWRGRRLEKGWFENRATNQPTNIPNIKPDKRKKRSNTYGRSKGTSLHFSDIDIVQWPNPH